MKDEFGWKIKKELFGLKGKTYSILIDHGNEDKHQEVCDKKN